MRQTTAKLLEALLVLGVSCSTKLVANTQHVLAFNA